ncbi:MAG: hypothetical protein JSR99_12385 [Proteobacteria bacterium]|nr:hypothetical protein [Pseudomonadota bacterium]
MSARNLSREAELNDRYVALTVRSIELETSDSQHAAARANADLESYFATLNERDQHSAKEDFNKMVIDHSRCYCDAVTIALQNSWKRRPELQKTVAARATAKKCSSRDD